MRPEPIARPWVRPVIRCAVYLYYAAGMALLLSDGMVSALRYESDKKLSVSFLLFVFVGIFGLLAFSSWDAFQRPISRRKWILLCLLSSLGILRLIFAPTSYGGTAV